MLIEVVVSITLLGMILGGLSLTQRATRGHNAIQLARQHCIAAGEAQLDRLAACGLAMDPAQVESLWPGVRTQLAVAEGQGTWQGLKLVTVQATTRVQSRTVSEALSRYYDRPLEVQP